MSDPLSSPNISSPNPDQPASAGASRPRIRQSGRGILVWMFRLLLLGVGGGFAWLIGVAIAHVYPAPSTQTPPLLERGFRQFDALMGSARRLPRPWSGPASSNRDTSEGTASTTTSPAENSSSELSAAQKQQLQTELTQIQQDFQALRDRTAAVETQLGSSRADQPLEARLSGLAQQLSPGGSSTPTTGSSESSPVSEIPTVILPSDILFAPNQSALRPDVNTILDSVIAELRNYPGAKIQIAAHTDNSASPQASRDLSFQQAQAVEQYLSEVLGDQYRWVSVGYGDSNPLADNTTEANQQRNRRIEISIHSP